MGIAGTFVRVETCHYKRIPDPIVDVGLRQFGPQIAKRLGDGISRLQLRVERLVGLLEDDLHLRAQTAKVARGQVLDVTALQCHPAGIWPLEHRRNAAQRRLARTTLADERHRLSAPDRQGDITDRGDRRAGTPERLVDVLDHHHRGRRTRRRVRGENSLPAEANRAGGYSPALVCSGLEHRCGTRY